MSILRFEDFMNEAEAGKPGKPVYKTTDPKSERDFKKLVDEALDRFTEKHPDMKNDTIAMASTIRNVMTSYLNKMGPFKDRSGSAVPKPLTLISNKGTALSKSNLASMQKNAKATPKPTKP